jgi:hypothetical protein
MPAMPSPALAARQQHLDDLEAPTVWTATGRERPVFLDERGHRRRWVMLGGALAGGLTMFWMGALLAGAIGFSGLPSLRPLADANHAADATHAGVLHAEVRGPRATRAAADLRELAEDRDRPLRVSATAPAQVHLRRT